MQLIKGREIADNILVDIKSKILEMGTKPTLAVFLIGEDEASKIYVGLKEKAARDIGMDFKLFRYDANISEQEILARIEDLNKDKNISGIIVQLPLPEGLDKNKIINAISPEKDVDGFHCENQKKFCCGAKCKIFPVFPKAIIKMVEFAIGENSLENVNKAVIICVSDDFGIIMQEAFKKINIEAQYIFCDNLVSNSEELKEADVVVTACGVINIINSAMVKAGAIVIDGGIIKIEGKVHGDVDIESFKNQDVFVSPVPGGVGPVTVACLLENTFLAGVK
ncbi:MAG: bifunctional 5,10-methylenetetrahydrofolate dehydrogenase/5,10-methenyltetrahydrofolate cyclohydrolase [Candidatus Moranbacteria bacterium]|nr:bifunctional 5,10-methylenetetrahydrofolate dehydrogenase/5,10-methenyltetrahydrofolate cyclohydrolase [Candidatus Moranbacteria bacterium]